MPHPYSRCLRQKGKMNWTMRNLPVFMKRFILPVVVFFLSGYVFGSPPFITDDADVTPNKHIQSYLYSAGVSVSSGTLLNIPAIEIDYGFIQNAEIDWVVQMSSSIPSSGKSTTGLGDSEAKIKYVVLNESKYCPAIAIAPALELPTGNAKRNLGNGKLWYVLPLWIEKHWGPWTTYGGGGYALNPAKAKKNYLFGGWVLERNVTDQLTLGVEFYTQGATAPSYVPDSGFVTLLNLGSRYNFNSSTSFLVSVGHNMVGVKAWYGYLGFGLGF